MFSIVRRKIVILSCIYVEYSKEGGESCYFELYICSLSYFV